MYWFRRFLSALLSVAILVAPMTAAWASGTKGMGVAMLHPASHAVAGEASVAASPGVAASTMEDCDSMMKGAAGKDDCPCCDKDKACPPQFCMAKCFQFLGLDLQSQPVAKLVAAQFPPAAPEHPPDWSDQPQSPPPRT